VNKLLGDARDSERPLGYGAIGRYFRVHRDLLEEQLRMEKVRNTTAHLYAFRLREDDETVTDMPAAA
jgi:hypothetical protein